MKYVDQAMKAEKDNAMDRCDLCEQVVNVQRYPSHRILLKS